MGTSRSQSFMESDVSIAQNLDNMELGNSEQQPPLVESMNVVKNEPV